MPPLVTDDEEVSGDEIPFKEAPPKSDVEEEVEEEGSDEDEEVYVVEAIINHNYDETGGLIYEVKWQGYPKKADHTWEPEENLVTAQETLEIYFKKIGGRPSAVPEKKSKKRKTEDIDTPKNGRKKAKPESPAPTSSKKAAQTKEWRPPTGSWESHLMNIDTIEESKDPKTNVLERYAYVVWNDGRKTRHKLTTLNVQAPQKMLRYYEQHLVFKTGEEDANGVQ